MEFYKSVSDFFFKKFLLSDNSSRLYGHFQRIHNFIEYWEEL